MPVDNLKDLLSININPLSFFDLLNPMGVLIFVALDPLRGVSLNDAARVLEVLSRPIVTALFNEIPDPIV